MCFYFHVTSRRSSNVNTKLYRCPVPTEILNNFRICTLFLLYTYRIIHCNNIIFFFIELHVCKNSTDISFYMKIA